MTVKEFCEKHGLPPTAIGVDPTAELTEEEMAALEQIIARKTLRETD